MNDKMQYAIATTTGVVATLLVLIHILIFIFPQSNFASQYYFGSEGSALLGYLFFTYTPFALGALTCLFVTKLYLKKPHKLIFPLMLGTISISYVVFGIFISAVYGLFTDIFFPEPTYPASYFMSAIPFNIILAIMSLVILILGTKTLVSNLKLIKDKKNITLQKLIAPFLILGIPSFFVLLILIMGLQR